MAQSEAARRYGVSRRWVYEFLLRYASDGDAGLEPGSRAPHSNPHQVPEAMPGSFPCATSCPLPGWMPGRQRSPGTWNKRACQRRQWRPLPGCCARAGWLFRNLINGLGPRCGALRRPSPMRPGSQTSPTDTWTPGHQPRSGDPEFPR
nr:helix-turn-helix domain-containing protein [Arthrobacter sp. ERGS1:01]